MRIMTFNIQHGLDYKNKVIDLGLFADAISRFGADVCGLNEVRDEGPHKEYTDQAGCIARKIGFHHYFGEAIRFDGNNPYGNAIVSRFPFDSVETIIIPDPADKSEPTYYETRCVIRAVAEIEGKKICFLVCHMGLAKTERISAVDTILEILDKTDIPTILMGDFNAQPDASELAPLFERLSDVDGVTVNRGALTCPSDAPTEKIDYILYRGLTCKRAEIITEVISDHFPVIAEFE